MICDRPKRFSDAGTAWMTVKLMISSEWGPVPGYQQRHAGAYHLGRGNTVLRREPSGEQHQNLYVFAHGCVFKIGSTLSTRLQGTKGRYSTGH